jgi:hypothetical protein
MHLIKHNQTQSNPNRIARLFYRPILHFDNQTRYAQQTPILWANPAL